MQLPVTVEAVEALRSDLLRSSEEITALRPYVPAMLATYEGRLYLRMLTETADGALDWAKTHCAVKP